MISGPNEAFDRYRVNPKVNPVVGLFTRKGIILESTQINYHTKAFYRRAYSFTRMSTKKHTFIFRTSEQ